MRERERGGGGKIEAFCDESGVVHKGIEFYVQEMLFD